MYSIFLKMSSFAKLPSGLAHFHPQTSEKWISTPAVDNSQRHYSTGRQNSPHTFAALREMPMVDAVRLCMSVPSALLPWRFIQPIGVQPEALVQTHEQHRDTVQSKLEIWPLQQCLLQKFHSARYSTKHTNWVNPGHRGQDCSQGTKMGQLYTVCCGLIQQQTGHD